MEPLEKGSGKAAGRARPAGPAGSPVSGEMGREGFYNLAFSCQKGALYPHMVGGGRWTLAGKAVGLRASERGCGALVGG